MDELAVSRSLGSPSLSDTPERSPARSRRRRPRVRDDAEAPPDAGSLDASAERALEPPAADARPSLDIVA